MPALDFAKIKVDYPLEAVADRLGLKLKKHGNAMRGPCPTGEGDDRALVITPGKGWYSFAAQKGGDVIALVALVKGLSVKDAAAWIVGHQVTEPEKGTKGEAGDGFTPLDYLQSDHDAITALGFPEAVAKAVGIGYAPRGILRGKVAIPVRLPNGKLIGYCGIEDATLPSDWKL